MTKEVNITIRGLQAGTEDEPVEITAGGTYHFTNGRHYVQYEENLEDKSAIIKNIMKISSDRIVLMKKGKQSSEMVFDLYETEQALYQTPYGTFNFETNTKSITFRESEDRIVVRMEYSLSADSNKISDNEITIIIENAAAPQI